jgi:hypothetical protein
MLNREFYEEKEQLQKTALEKGKTVDMACDNNEVDTVLLPKTTNKRRRPDASDTHTDDASTSPDVTAKKPRNVKYSMYGKGKHERLGAHQGQSAELTNSCVAISFGIAHIFRQALKLLSNAELDHIINESASRMRLIRDLLKAKEGSLDSVDCNEVLIALRGLFASNFEKFKLSFPFAYENMCMDFTPYVGIIWNDDDFAQLQASVERRLAIHGECAISITLKGHTVTGCFDVEVHPHVVVTDEFGVIQ